MKAMVLAAGLGTRLRPLTNDRPKALVEISGRPLLEINLAHLRAAGVTDVIVNVHHFAEKIADYLRAHSNFGLHIEISREDDLLLDTGGGLKKASWFFLEDPNRLDDPFILHNVDILTNIDLSSMLQFHGERNALATLAVQRRASSRLLLFDSQNQLTGRSSSTGTPTQSLGASGKGSVIPSDQNSVISSEARNLSSPTLNPLAFSGIHVISPRLLPLLTESGVFSIIDAYVRLAAQGHKILGFPADQYYWRDLGRPSDLAQASADVQQRTLSLP
jgi:NDP-sugar pyrophosphorylase family protein